MIGKEETDMPEEPVVNMTRKQLYDETWEISVAGLARKYDIPYSQLLKQIKEAAIPVPPSGYWTQLSFGKPATKQLLKYEEERKRYSWASKPQIRKYDHVFNGRLSLTVNGQKSFRDCKSYVLEDRLGDIMIELYEAAEEIKKAHEAREEAERKRQEEERRKEERRKRYNVEVDRTLALTNLAKDYDTACKIRRYIAVVEASGTPDEKTAEWIEWAKAKADWYDPTVAREDEFFGKREHEKGAEKKKLEHKGYWW